MLKSIFTRNMVEMEYAIFNGEENSHFVKDSQVIVTEQYISRFIKSVKQGKVRSRLKAYKEIV